LLVFVDRNTNHGAHSNEPRSITGLEECVNGLPCDSQIPGNLLGQEIRPAVILDPGDDVIALFVPYN